MSTPPDPSAQPPEAPQGPGAPAPPHPPLHPLLEPLAFLLGTWRGEGAGEYPTAEPFRYAEEVRFWHAGTPVLFYAQRTINLATGLPSHSEMGYVRPLPDGGVELVIAHPTGVTEISEGWVDGASLHVRSRVVACSLTAKLVTELEREIEVDDGRLRYRLLMAAVGHPLQHHLAAELVRVDEEG